MKWFKLLAIMVVLAAFAVCFPKSAYLKVFRDTYHPKGALASATCNICHMTKAGGKLNAYGKALSGKVHGGKVTAAALKSVEKMDSFGKNIKAGKLPAGK
jgi:hypothetical protein